MARSLVDEFCIIICVSLVAQMMGRSGFVVLLSSTVAAECKTDEKDIFCFISGAPSRSHDFALAFSEGARA